MGDSWGQLCTCTYVNTDILKPDPIRKYVWACQSLLGMSFRVSGFEGFGFRAICVLQAQYESGLH